MLRNSILAAVCALVLLIGGAFAADPTTDNVEALLALTKTCEVKVGGPWATDKASWNDGKAYICGDRKGTAGKQGAVYWTADMDIDCDGKVTPGKCDKEHDCCFQAQTAFQNSKGEHLTAAVDPYYVIPNNFNLANNGIAKWQIAAIIFEGKLTYAFLADTGPPNIIGEASYATAVILGINPDAKVGGTEGPVTYIVFTGEGGRPKIPEDHNEVLEVGAKAAAAFLSDNGVTPVVQAKRTAPRMAYGRNTVRVDFEGRHALKITDAAGNVVSWKTAGGPTNHDLSDLQPGVYFVRTILPGKPSTPARRTVVY